MLNSPTWVRTNAEHHPESNPFVNVRVLDSHGHDETADEEHVRFLRACDSKLEINLPKRGRNVKEKFLTWVTFWEVFFRTSYAARWLTCFDSDPAKEACYSYLNKGGDVFHLIIHNSRKDSTDGDSTIPDKRLLVTMKKKKKTRNQHVKETRF